METVFAAGFGFGVAALLIWALNKISICYRADWYAAFLEQTKRPTSPNAPR